MKPEVQWIDGRDWAEDCLAMELSNQAESMFGTTDCCEAMRLLYGWISRLPDKELEAMLQRLRPSALLLTRKQAFTPADEFLEEIYNTHCLRRARTIIGDSSHPGHHLFELLPSGRYFRAIKTKANGLKNSFYPRAVVALNTANTTKP